MKKVSAFIISFVILLWIWEIVVLSGRFPESLFPSPMAVGQNIIRMTQSGSLILDIGASMYRFFMGYLSASILAILLGLIFGCFPEVWKYVNPVIQFLRPISPMAWLPFIVLWVGIGDIPAIVIIFLAAFFPVLLTTVSAVNKIDSVYIKIAQNFGLGRIQTLFKVIFPAVFPQIVNGLHLAVGTAWIFLVAGEMAGSQSGLGYRIVEARNNLQVDILLATIVVIGILGIILDIILHWLEDQANDIWGINIEKREQR